MTSSVAPQRYHCYVAMNLRLSDEEAEALREEAERNGISMQRAIREAIADWVVRSRSRPPVTFIGTVDTGGNARQREYQPEPWR
ncbi:MAG: ribbon-helix-helix protein, CopG family [Candidatus Dormiibacterota bacterium]